MRVKICGITNLEDALAASDAGADFIGFIFAESPRRIDPSDAAEIIKQLPAYITTVGVFAGMNADEIVDVIKITGIDCAQVYDHKNCNLQPVAKEIGCRRVIRVFNVSGEEDIAELENAAKICDCCGFLLDTYVEGKAGGTGRVFNWDLAARAVKSGKAIILAGGLNPENVSDAINRVHPRVVDVSSGVESCPGKKDHEKIREFIKNARQSV